MNSNFSMIIRKFAAPLIFTVLGLIVLIYGFTTNQDGTFILASVFLFAAALISMLYSSGKVKPAILNIVGIVAGLAALFTIYMSWTSVKKSEHYREIQKLTELKAQQNLADIRFIQKNCAEATGKYASNWEEFISYAKEAKMQYIDAKGSVPGRRLSPEESRYIYKDNRPQDNNMTEEEAYILSKWTEGPNYAEFASFIRDTTYVSLLETKFGSASYVDTRMINGLGAFSLDSLPYIPWTKEKWTIETRDSVLVGDQKFPAIRVSGKLPFAKIEGAKRPEIYFGNLTSNETGGSWE